MDEMLEHVQASTDAIRALQSGRPYRVIRKDITWDITESGHKTHVRRVKKLEFEQNEVLTILDWLHGDGNETSVEHKPGNVVHKIKADGRDYSVIAFDRPYSRGQKLDFQTDRIVEDAFPKSQERVNLVAREFTQHLTMRIIWPADRPPTTVHLHETDPDGSVSTEDVTGRLKKQSDGRAALTYEAHEPPRGGKTTIEWDWGAPVRSQSRQSAIRVS